MSGVVAEPRIDYLEQVGPILTKAGGTMGGCHASQHRQAGFKLSVFGFDPPADRLAVIGEAHIGRATGGETEWPGV